MTLGDTTSHLILLKGTRPSGRRQEFLREVVQRHWLKVASHDGGEWAEIKVGIISLIRVFIFFMCKF